jgi:flagellar assembly protein FliH
LSIEADPFPLLEELPPLLPLDDPAALAADRRRRSLEEAAAAEGRRAGFERGLFEGRAHGEFEARQAVEGRVAELVDRTERALVALRDEVDAGRANVSGEVVDLALRIAEAVVGRAIDLDQVGGRDALIRALALAPDRGDLTARLHPEDAASIGDVAELVAGRELTVVSDPMLRRGDCVLDIGSTRVDATLAGAFERVREVLLPAMDVDAAFEEALRS